jgi:hypothetical protein
LPEHVQEMLDLYNHRVNFRRRSRPHLTLKHRKECATNKGRIIYVESDTQKGAFFRPLRDGCKHTLERCVPVNFAHDGLFPKDLLAVHIAGQVVPELITDCNVTRRLSVGGRNEAG